MRTSAFHHCSASHSAPAPIPKHSAQNPLAVSRVTIGNWSLITACQRAVYWPQRTVSSHPGFSMLLLTVSCKTAWKILLKSRHLTTTGFSYQQGLLLCLRRKRDGFQVIYSWQIHASCPGHILVPFKGFMICCLFVPCIGSYTTWLQILGFSCFSLLWIDTISALFPFSRTSPILHDFWG